MFETEDLRNDMVIDNAEEVNILVLPEEVYNSEIKETKSNPSGILIGAAIAATGVVAYKYGPMVLNKVKGMLNKKTNETLEGKQKRLLEELAVVNEQLTSEEN